MSLSRWKLLWSGKVINGEPSIERPPTIKLWYYCYHSYGGIYLPVMIAYWGCNKSATSPIWSGSSAAELILSVFCLLLPLLERVRMDVRLSEAFIWARSSSFEVIIELLLKTTVCAENVLPTETCCWYGRFWWLCCCDVSGHSYFSNNKRLFLFIYCMEYLIKDR